MAPVARVQWAVKFVLKNGTEDTRFAWAGEYEPQQAIEYCCAQSGFAGAGDPRVHTIECRRMGVEDKSVSVNEDVTWVAQVVLETGTTCDVEVKARAYDRTGAMAKAYTTLGLTGPNDPKVKSMNCMLKSVAMGGKREDNLRAAKLNGPRYRVELYPSPLSKNSRIQSGRAANATDMLQSIAGMCGVKDLATTGPYLVQEYTDEGLVTRLVRYPTTFPDAGRLGEVEKSAQSNLIKNSTRGELVWCSIQREYVTERQADLNAAFHARKAGYDERYVDNREWTDDDWWAEAAGTSRSSPRERMLTSISDFLDNETKVVKPKFKVEVK